MTAPLFYRDDLAPDLGAGTVVRIDGPEAHHAIRVRRLGPGEALIVSDGRGLAAHGAIESVDADAFTVRVDRVIHEEPPAHRLVLVQALAKGDRDLLAIEAATEIGVDEVIPFAAERSVVTWRGPRAEKAHAKWESTVRRAAQQARRSMVPAVGELMTARQLAAAAGAGTDTAIIVLHEDSAQSLAGLAASRPAPLSARTLLVVGPEGGIGEAELAVFEAAGARTARLGPHVLRSSTAGPVALSVLLAGTGRW